MQRSWFLFFVCLAACGGDDDVLDAAADAPDDTGADAVVVRDAGPPCPLECEAGTTCCFGADGEPGCVDLQSSLDHCGQCGFVCSADRGTACVEGLCECGRSTIGCEGSRASLCCPPREEGAEPYCANLLVDGLDCGGCGAECDPRTSDQCQAGECACGDERRACTAEEGELCCPSFGGASSLCVMPATDRNHCGACGRRCRSGEDCVAGECRSRFDAGTPDAGTDAGTDAGEDDAGIDAGELDAGSDAGEEVE